MSYVKSSLFEVLPPIKKRRKKGRKEGKKKGREGGRQGRKERKKRKDKMYLKGLYKSNRVKDA
jgi:hypothetical protein